MRQAPRPTGQPSDQTGQFVAAILGSADVQWTELLAQQNSYLSERRGWSCSHSATASACGAAQSAMGPFYCPNDREVYLDTSFFDELSRRFRGCNGKACEFAHAYVIAHEVGHHVQNLLGILPKMQQAQRAAGQGRRQPVAGAGRAAGRLFRRRVGVPFRPEMETHRARRRRGGAADRVRDRRRHGCRSGRRATRCVCPTPSPTARRSSASAGSPPDSRTAPSSLRYVQRGAALAISSRHTCPASTKPASSCR